MKFFDVGFVVLVPLRVVGVVLADEAVDSAACL